MFFDLRRLTYREAYRYLVSTVVPRPIALVTTVDREGTRNAAPFSFFNVMGHDPPVLVLGIESSNSGGLKDTASNIRSTGEFVVNLVSEGMANAMNLCSQSLSPEVDEIALSGLTSVESTTVRPPRIAESPVSFECREHTTVTIGDGRSIVIGSAIAMHLDDRYYDPERDRVRTLDMKLIARMHGADWYLRTSDVFQLPRPEAGGTEFARDGAHR
ncbi:MAG: flavin reductase family protein [Trueperaceae bacterium]